MCMPCCMTLPIRKRYEIDLRRDFPRVCTSKKISPWWAQQGS